MINPAASFLHLKCRFCCFKRSSAEFKWRTASGYVLFLRRDIHLNRLNLHPEARGCTRAAAGWRRRVEVGHHSLCVWYVWHKWSKQRDDHSWCSQTTRSSCPLSRPGVLPRHPETAKARTIQSVASAVTPKFFKLLQKAKPLVGLPYYLYVHTAGSTVAE